MWTQICQHRPVGQTEASKNTKMKNCKKTGATALGGFYSWQYDRKTDSENPPGRLRCPSQGLFGVGWCIGARNWGFPEASIEPLLGAWRKPWKKSSLVSEKIWGVHCRRGFKRIHKTVNLITSTHVLIGVPLADYTCLPNKIGKFSVEWFPGFMKCFLSLQYSSNLGGGIRKMSTIFH